MSTDLTIPAMPKYKGYGARFNQITIDSTDGQEFPSLAHISLDQQPKGYLKTRDSLIQFPKLSSASKQHLDTQISLMGTELEYQKIR